MQEAHPLLLLLPLQLAWWAAEGAQRPSVGNYVCSAQQNWQVVTDLCAVCALPSVGEGGACCCQLVD